MWIARRLRTARLALAVPAPMLPDSVVFTLPTGVAVACAWSLIGVGFSALLLGLAPSDPVGPVLADLAAGLG